MTLKALVVDDEPIARRAVLRLLREAPDIVVVGECGDGVAAVEAIRSQRPDLVFLDIQMPGISGLDVVATIGAATMPATVFVTAYEDYAVRAFEANALDYLVKPFGRERFARTLERARARMAASAGGMEAASMTRILQTLDALQQRERYLDRIPVRADERVHLVDVADIVWIRANRNSVQLHTGSGVHDLRETMSSLEARLDPRRFVRVHRSAIVNVGRIKGIDPWFNGYHVVTMDSGQQLRMSRYQREAFLRLATLRTD